MRLDDAIALALANNERARKAPLRVEVAEGQLDRARTAFYPALTAGATFGLRGIEDRSGRIWSANGTLTLTQPLVNPSAYPSYAQAGHTLASERWGAEQDRRQVAFDAARAFLQALTAERVLEAANRRLERARFNARNAEARVAAQLASTNDLTKQALELASAQREVAQAEGTVQRATIALGFVVGRPVQGPLVTPDRTSQAAEVGGERLDAAGAPKRRPDLRSLEERTLALRASAREPMLRLVPSLSLSAQLRLTPGAVAPDPLHDETLTINLTWPIFDAGARYADRRARLAQVESQALDEQLTRRSIDTDTALAQASLRAARETYRLAEEAVLAAQRNSEETEVLYRQGLARALELADANARRFDAEVSRATAKLTMEQAYLELRQALGYWPTDAGGGK